MAEEQQVQDIFDISPSQEIEESLEALLKEEIEILEKTKANLLSELSNQDVITPEKPKPRIMSSRVMRAKKVAEQTPKSKETKIVSSAKKITKKRKSVPAVSSSPAAQKRKIASSIPSTARASVTSPPPAKKKKTVRAKVVTTKKVAPMKKKAVKKRVSNKLMKKITKQVAVKRSTKKA